jgi:NAD(P)H-flavin reductase
LKDSPEKLGVHGENIWINSKNVHGTMKEQTDALFSGEPEICYVSFPSVRSGQKGNHIAIVIALVNYSAFTEWEKQSWRMKDPSYYALKKRLTESLISTVEKKLPGFSELIRYSEMSTPLTMNYFASRAKGAMYGFKPTPRFMSKKWFNVKTPIKGLYLTGTDVCSPGVVGAMMGGLAAASVLNGPLGFIKIVVNARIASRKRKPQFTPHAVNSIRPDYSITSDKILAKLIDKVQLTDTTFEFTYQSSKEIDYCPGQYARIQFGEANYGSYSIVTAKDKVLKFIIETKFGGMYADYFLSLEPGDYSSIRLPLGDFFVRQSDNKKIFISTGTGIAPQLAMIDVISNNTSDKEIDIYFGCSYAKDNFITRYLQDFEKKININLHICISREKKEGFIHGRVTAPLNEIKDNLQKCDFYISGNPLMVAETVGILRKKGAPTIYSENF